MPHMPKTAVCAGNSGGADSFEIIGSKRRTMYAGELGKPLFDEASGEHVSIIDFSTFNVSGKYYIKIGRKLSDPFVISPSPYDNLKASLLKSFYYNRCGKLEKEIAGEYSHPACHKTAYLYDDKSKLYDASGGWHDLGGYGKYSVSACAALGHLLYAHQFFPESFGEDLLDECRFGLEWLLKMQSRDGGVYHKITPLEESGVTLPESDNANYYIFPKSHKATAGFTAAAALASRIFNKIDPDFSKRLKYGAINGWIWLMNNPDYKPFVNPPEATLVSSVEKMPENYGSYIFWAASELYALTGDPSFGKKSEELCAATDITGTSQTRAGGFGAMAYLFGGGHKSADAERRIKLQLRVSADNLYSLARESGYRISKKASDFVMGSNADILNSAVILILSYMIFGCRDYLEAASEHFNYILGKNPMGICYVTGYGATRPHHKRSAAGDVDGPVPGMVVSGPNRLREDEFAKWNIPIGAPAAKCYCDAVTCYSTNETSICFSAPAVFAAGFFTNPNGVSLP